MEIWSVNSKSAQIIQDAKALVQQGEQFDFAKRYDYPTVLAWIKNVAGTIGGLDYEHGEFRLYCTDAYLVPEEKVKHCLLLLRSLLLRFELEKWLK